MPGLVLVAWPLPREPGRGWRSLEEPGGAATAQLLLAGSGGPSAASPESCRDSERAAHCWHSCVLQGLAQRNLGPRNAQTLLLHPKHLSRARLCPLIGTAWLPAGDSHRLVVTPSPSAPRFARTGCSVAKAAPVPHLPYLGDNAEEGEEEELLLQLEPHGALPCALQHITPQAVWRQWRVRRF